jgi:GAF domain-containing protein/HAMP domain-containing protein
MFEQEKATPPTEYSETDHSPEAARFPHSLRALWGGTIRNRLLVAFVVLVLLPAVVTSSISAIAGFRGGQEQVEDQLELLADFRQVQIDAWKKRLQTELAAVLEEARILVYAQEILTASPDEVDSFKHPLEQGLNAHSYRTRDFDEIFLLDQNGQKIATSGTSEKYYVSREEVEVIVQEVSHADRTYFQQGLKGTSVSLYSPEENRWGVLAVRPVPDARGNVIGVLCGYVDLDELNEIMQEQTGLGKTVRTYLVEPGHTLLTGPVESVYVSSPGVDTVITNRADNRGLYKDYRGVPVTGIYRWLPGLDVALVAEQEQAEAFQNIYQTMGFNIGVTVVAMVLAVIAALFITRSIANPLSDLAETATQIAAGDLDRVAELGRKDEVGALAMAFNQMSRQLREMITGLEDQVSERTHQLQEANYKLQRRAIQLEASAQVGKAVSSILDLGSLLSNVVGLIREHFDFYHVGIFLLDETEKWAVLQQATGEAGQRMLAKGHRLAVGGRSIVGWVTANRKPRVTLDVDADFVHYKNPDLPYTRSEIALPLIVGDRLLGALDVQSVQESAFDAEDVAILSLMADQVTVAVDNALKFSAEADIIKAANPHFQVSRHITLATSLDDVLNAIVSYAIGAHVDRCTISLYGGSSKEGEPAYLDEAAVWDRAEGNPGPVGTRYPLESLKLLKHLSGERATPVQLNDILTSTADERVDMATRRLLAMDYQLRSVLMLPLVAAGQTLGLLIIASRQPHTWTETELSNSRSLGDQISVAVQNTRLLEEARQRAKHERLTREVTARMRETLEIDTVLQSAVDEISQSLGLAALQVQLNIEPE